MGILGICAPDCSVRSATCEIPGEALVDAILSRKASDFAVEAKAAEAEERSGKVAAGMVDVLVVAARPSKVPNSGSKAASMSPKRRVSQWCSTLNTASESRFFRLRDI